MCIKRASKTGAGFPIETIQTRTHTNTSPSFANSETTSSKENMNHFNYAPYQQIGVNGQAATPRTPATPVLQNPPRQPLPGSRPVAPPPPPPPQRNILYNTSLMSGPLVHVGYDWNGQPVFREVVTYPPPPVAQSTAHQRLPPAQTGSATYPTGQYGRP
jgi:hypothetical protein